MSFAPTGPLPTLPNDWQERIQRRSLHDHGLLNPFVKYLAGVVCLHGDRSIALEQVQRLAVWSCSDTVPEMFPWYLDVFGHLADLAGKTWPIEIPLDEYSAGHKSIDQIMKDVDSMQAEWLVLHRLVLDGWRPVKTNRDHGTPDWAIEKAGRELNVDAKYKATPGSCHGRLTWMLRGAAMLPAHSFLRRFIWSWSVPSDCRDKTVAACLNLFYAGLVELRELVADSAMPDSQAVVVDDNVEQLQLESYDDAIDLTFVTRSGNVQLSGRPNPGTPHLFSPGGARADFAREPTDEMREELGKAINRLNLKKLQTCLFVIVWEVPFTWESDWSLEQVGTWWSQLSDQYNWPPAILWPIGSFEAAGAPWIPNLAAADVLHV